MSQADIRPQGFVLNLVSGTNDRMEPASTDLKGNQRMHHRSSAVNWTGMMPVLVPRPLKPDLPSTQVDGDIFDIQRWRTDPIPLDFQRC